MRSPLPSSPDEFERVVCMLEEILGAPPPVDLEGSVEGLGDLVDGIDAFARQSFPDLASRRRVASQIALAQEAFLRKLLWLCDAATTGLPQKSYFKLAKLAMEAGLLPMSRVPTDADVHPPRNPAPPSTYERAFAVAYEGRNRAAHDQALTPLDWTDATLVVLLGAAHHLFHRLADGRWPHCRTDVPPARGKDPPVGVTVRHPAQWRSVAGAVVAVPVDPSGSHTFEVRRDRLLVLTAEAIWFADTAALPARLEAACRLQPNLLDAGIVILNWPALRLDHPARQALAAFARARGLAVRLVVEPPTRTFDPPVAAPARLRWGGPERVPVDLGSMPGLDRSPWLLLVETAEPGALIRAMRGAEAALAGVGERAQDWIELDGATLATTREPLAAAVQGQPAAPWHREFPLQDALSYFVRVVDPDALGPLEHQIRATPQARWVVTSLVPGVLSVLSDRLGRVRATLEAVHCARFPSPGPPLALAGRLAPAAGSKETRLAAWCEAVAAATDSLDSTRLPRLAAAYEAAAHAAAGDDINAMVSIVRRGDAISSLRTTLGEQPAEVAGELAVYLAQRAPSLVPGLAGSMAALPPLRSAALLLAFGAGPALGEAAVARCVEAALGDSPTVDELGELGRLATAALQEVQPNARGRLRLQLVGAFVAPAVGQTGDVRSALVDLVRTIADPLEACERALMVALAEGSGGGGGFAEPVELAILAGPGGRAWLWRQLRHWLEDPSDGGSVARPVPDMEDRAFWSRVQRLEPELAVLAVVAAAGPAARAAVGLDRPADSVVRSLAAAARGVVPFLDTHRSGRC